MVIGGALIALGKKAGGIFVMIVMLFMILTQDNPFIKEHIKPKPKTTKLRINDLTRHVSVVGACMYYMFTDPVEEPEPVKKQKKN